MPYVVYDKDTTKIYPRWDKAYESAAAAKAAITRNKLDRDQYHWAEAYFFKTFVEKRVVKKNLLTGVEFEESVNTPHFCSPSSESYWSM